MDVRPVAEEDFAAVVQINADAEKHLNSQATLTVGDLRELRRLAGYFKVACVDRAVAGFLIAVRSGTSHADPNYQWFSARYPEFLYIDRIVVDSGFRGRKLGSALYTDLFSFARASGAPFGTCEIDCDPPNHVSSAFHAGFGFTEVGRHPVDGGKKTVSLQVAPV